MTKTPKTADELKSDCDRMEIASLSNRKNNYKNQKPILEKRRRDRINNSLDELKSLLLAIKQRDPLRYARLEKADILEMVVKHLKDIKKRRQAMVAAMEPILFRSFKMGFMDCTKATIDFINEIETPGEKKQLIVEHITKECMRTFQSQCPPPSFTQHHEIAFSTVNPSDQFLPFPLLSSLDREFEWPSLEERLGFSPIGKSSFLLPDIKPLPELVSSSLLKIAEPRASAFNVVSKASSGLDSPSTSGASVTVDEIPQRSISISILDDSSSSSDDDNEDDDNDQLMIDDPNNNQLTWRPWL